MVYGIIFISVGLTASIYCTKMTSFPNKMEVGSKITDFLNLARVGGFHMLINFHARFRYFLIFARVGGFHMQGS